MTVGGGYPLIDRLRSPRPRRARRLRTGREVLGGRGSSRGTRQSWNSRPGYGQGSLRLPFTFQVRSCLSASSHAGPRHSPVQCRPISWQSPCSRPEPLTQPIETAETSAPKRPPSDSSSPTAALSATRTASTLTATAWRASRTHAPVTTAPGEAAVASPVAEGEAESSLTRSSATRPDHQGHRRRHRARKAEGWTQAGRSTPRHRHPRGLQRARVRWVEGFEGVKKVLPRNTRVMLVSDRTQDLADRYKRLLRYVMKGKSTRPRPGSASACRRPTPTTSASVATVSTSRPRSKRSGPTEDCGRPAGSSRDLLRS